MTDHLFETLMNERFSARSDPLQLFVAKRVEVPIGRTPAAVWHPDDPVYVNVLLTKEGLPTRLPETENCHREKLLDPDQQAKPQEYLFLTGNLRSHALGGRITATLHREASFAEIAASPEKRRLVLIGGVGQE